MGLNEQDVTVCTHALSTLTSPSELSEYACARFLNTVKTKTNT